MQVAEKHRRKTHESTSGVAGEKKAKMEPWLEPMEGKENSVQHLRPARGDREEGSEMSAAANRKPLGFRKGERHEDRIAWRGRKKIRFRFVALIPFENNSRLYSNWRT